jgi:hypothetical protein
MSRNVTKPHGLTITSGNTYHFMEGLELRNFKSMLRFEPYDFGDDVPYSMLHAQILTPAMQLCWREIAIPFPTTAGFDEWRYYRQPAEWFRRYLDETAPGWAVRPPRPGISSECVIFLAKRQHALAICARVAELLGEIPSAVGPKLKA